MSPTPQKVREICLLVLCAHQTHFDQDPQLLRTLARELKIGGGIVQSGRDRAALIASRQSDLDVQIDATSQGFSPKRIGLVERNALRLGLFEIQFDEHIPPKVAISEAVRLVRKFGSRESGKFVNAILDQLFKQTSTPDS